MRKLLLAVLGLTTITNAQTNNITQSVSATTITSQYINLNSASATSINSPNTYVNGALKVTGDLNASTIYIASPAGNLNVASELIANKNALAGKASLSQVNAINEATNSVRNSVTNLTDVVITNANNASNSILAVQNNLNTEISRLDSSIEKTNINVAKNTSNIENLQLTKADKTQVVTDIAKSKSEAITTSNTYTDGKISNLKGDLTFYTDNSVKESESRLNKRVDALELKVDTGFKDLFRYAYSEFQAVNNRIEGLGASMVALSAAASSQIYNPSKPTNLNIGTGVYGRATAIAVGLSHYFNPQTKLSVNWSQGTNTNNAVGVGIGFGF